MRLLVCPELCALGAGTLRRGRVSCGIASSRIRRYASAVGSQCSNSAPLPACAEMSNGGCVAARKADGPDAPANRSVGQEPEMTGAPPRLATETNGVAKALGWTIGSAAGFTAPPGQAATCGSGRSRSPRRAPPGAPPPRDSGPGPPGHAGLRWRHSPKGVRARYPGAWATGQDGA